LKASRSEGEKGAKKGEAKWPYSYGVVCRMGPPRKEKGVAKFKKKGRKIRGKKSGTEFHACFPKTKARDGEKMGEFEPESRGGRGKKKKSRGVWLFFFTPEVYQARS